MTTKSQVIAIGILCVSLLVAACGTPKTQVGKSGKSGATAGALAGLVFGGSLSDVVTGAAIGGLAGAAVGSAKSKEQQDAARTAIAQEESGQRMAMEQEAQRRAQLQVEYEQRLRSERQKLEAATASTGSSDGNWLNDPDMLERAFGKDSVAGLYALRDCQHDKAIIAASAAENSPVASHQLAAVWLRAMVAMDLNRATSASVAYRQLVVIDPEVVTVEDAKIGTSEALAVVRTDREGLGIVCST